MRQVYKIGLVMIIAALVSGCPSSRSGDVYTREQARKVLEVKLGVVEDVRAVQLEGTEGTVGTAAGAALGAIGGSTVGEGRGSAAAAVVGALLGGLAGAAAEEGYTRKPGVEITVRLDNGSVVAVTQEAEENVVFQVGSRVKLLTDYDGISRVVNLSASRPLPTPLPNR